VQKRISGQKIVAKLSLMRILFISEYFHGEPDTEVGGVFQRMQMLIDGARTVGELDMLFYVHSGIDTSPESIEKWEKVLSARWGTDLALFLCHRLDVSNPRLSLNKRIGLIARLLARGAFEVSVESVGMGTSGTLQVHALESCLDRRPDLIIAHRLGAVAPLLLTRRKIPPVLFDLDDVEHLKYERFIDSDVARRSGVLAYVKKRLILMSEFRAIRLAHRTFVCSDQDKETIGRLWPRLNVVTVPNAVSSRALTPTPVAQTILFIGYYGYEPNAQAADFLITEIWPIIRDALPGARLLIAGKGAENIPAFGCTGPEVEFLNFVEDLELLYRRTRVVACPIQVGSGTRVKILEAAAFGKPIVATSIAAEGLEFTDGQEILLRDRAEDFAGACLELLNNDRKCRQLGGQARSVVTRRYNRNGVVANVSKLITDVVSLNK
jgi:glycosyltransferase involved in cell wall biosynthesis